MGFLIFFKGLEGRIWVVNVRFTIAMVLRLGFVSANTIFNRGALCNESFEES